MSMKVNEALCEALFSAYEMLLHMKINTCNRNEGWNFANSFIIEYYALMIVNQSSAVLDAFCVGSSCHCKFL
jgi:hypothetical protein